jgi:hypothetical protein
VQGTTKKTIKKINIITGLFLLLFALTVVPAVQAKELKEASPSSEAVIIAEYKLPYPGMLPDSPFYKLKTLRDKLVLFLIRDPYKKAQKHLQLADRILFEALKLAEKNNISLALHTAFKGENHMTQLVDTVKQAVYSGRALNSKLLNQAHKAAKKHKDLLAGMKSRAKGKNKDQFDIILEFSQRNDSELFKVEKEATIEAELEATSNPQEIQ